MLDRTAYDMVLLDVMMPGIDGIEVCRRIRKKSQIPVVMLTAKDRREERLEAISAGADDFLSKPIDQAELLARLRTGQRILKAEGALAEKVLELEQALHQVKHLEGIITICMHCRRIASGKDEWQKLEAYVEAHSNASFTHGLCRDCLDKHFPEGDPSESPAG